MPVPSELYLLITTYSLGPTKPVVKAFPHFTTNLRKANRDSTKFFNSVLRSYDIGNRDPDVNCDAQRKQPRKHKLDSKEVVEMVEVREFKIETRTLLPETGFVVLQIKVPQGEVMLQVAVHTETYAQLSDAFMRAAEMVDQASESQYKDSLGKSIVVEDHTNDELTLRAEWYDSIIGSGPTPVYAWVDVVKVAMEPHQG